MTPAIQRKSFAEEHTSAVTSTYHVVSDHGPVRLADVVRLSGLVEIRAQRALKELVDGRFVRKSPQGYSVR